MFQPTKFDIAQFLCKKGTKNINPEFAINSAIKLSLCDPSSNFDDLQQDDDFWTKFAQFLKIHPINGSKINILTFINLASQELNSFAGYYECSFPVYGNRISFKEPDVISNKLFEWGITKDRVDVSFAEIGNLFWFCVAVELGMLHYQDIVDLDENGFKKLFGEKFPQIFQFTQFTDSFDKLFETIINEMDCFNSFKIQDIRLDFVTQENRVKFKLGYIDQNTNFAFLCSPPFQDFFGVKFIGLKCFRGKLIIDFYPFEIDECFILPKYLKRFSNVLLKCDVGDIFEFVCDKNILTIIQNDIVIFRHSNVDVSPGNVLFTQSFNAPIEILIK